MTAVCLKPDHRHLLSRQQIISLNMKKILFVGAGQGFPNGAFEFLRSLRQYEPLSVTGLFFSPIEYGPIVAASEIPAGSPYARLREKEKKIVEDSKALFALNCSKNHIKYHIHENEEQWEKDILGKESRFSDLVLLSGELFYPDISTDQPNSFLQEALHVTECPMLIIREDYALLERLVFAYDGSKASLHAMKQFCYLLPQFTDLPTEIINVKNDITQEIPDIEKLRAYASLYFNSLSFSKLNFDAESSFAAWIGNKQHALLLSGSFGRSLFSYLARRSFVGKVIHDNKMPVFIAHT